MKRAVETAEEINKTLCIVPTLTQQLREVNAGDGNGKSVDWYREHQAPKNGYEPDYKPFPNAESDRELWNRLYPFCRQLMESSEERLLIVSHGTTLSFLQSMLMGYKFEDIAKFRFRGFGGSVSKFVLNPDGKTEAYYINQRVF